VCLTFEYSFQPSSCLTIGYGRSAVLIFPSFPSLCLTPIDPGQPRSTARDNRPLPPRQPLKTDRNPLIDRFCSSLCGLHPHSYCLLDDRKPTTQQSSVGRFSHLNSPVPPKSSLTRLWWFCILLPALLYLELVVNCYHTASPNQIHAPPLFFFLSGP